MKVRNKSRPELLCTYYHFCCLSFIIVVCSYFFSCVVFITEDDVDITIVLAVFSLAIQGRNVQIKTHPALTPANVVITLDKRTVADTTSMFSLKKPAGA